MKPEERSNILRSKGFCSSEASRSVSLPLEMWFIRRAPPPTPVPADASSVNIYCLASILIVMLALFAVCLIFLVRARYKSWINTAITEAFHRVDQDKSGTVDSEELYTCCLSIYLQLNMYGLYVIPPERPVVDALLREIDSRGNGNGALDFSEFKEAMQKLTAGAFSRCIVTVVLTFLCPTVAASIIAGFAHLWSLVASEKGIFPSWLEQSLSLMPSSLPKTVLTTALLMLRPLAQDVVANGGLAKLAAFAHKSASRKAKEM